MIRMAAHREKFVKFVKFVVYNCVHLLKSATTQQNKSMANQQTFEDYYSLFLAKNYKF